MLKLEPDLEKFWEIMWNLTGMDLLLNDSQETENGNVTGGIGNATGEIGDAIGQMNMTMNVWRDSALLEY